MQTISSERLHRLKPSFTTRRVDLGRVRQIDESAQDLASGDVVVARIEEIGQHTRVERPDGRRAHLFPGDETLLACGARYAPDQFEADCPSAVGPAHLAAAGGIAGLVRESHDKMRPATSIEILGAACDATGRRLNLRDFALPAPRGAGRKRPALVAVCGTSMNAGKTFAAASIVRGLAAAGRRVAAVKLTGTGSGGDLWQFRDAGARFVRDFTDAGLATTYRAAVEDILAAKKTLLEDVRAGGAEVVVLEVADGLGQEETAALLRDARFRDAVSGVLFAARDALSAAAGVAWLRAEGHAVRGVSGVLTRSPLAVRETRAAVDAPCLSPQELWLPEIAESLAGLRAAAAPVDQPRAA